MILTINVVNEYQTLITGVVADCMGSFTKPPIVLYTVGISCCNRKKAAAYKRLVYTGTLPGTYTFGFL